jgi:two-component system nitrogen regulation sensor histidine kinase GlnL
MGKEKVQNKKDRSAFSVDNNLVIRAIEPGIQELCSRSAQEIIGKKVNEIFPDLHEVIASTIAKGRGRHVRGCRSTCLRGVDFTFDVRVKPVKDRWERIKGAKVILDNISGECPVDRKTTGSERLVAIGKMASTLAHGVRNPLNAIKGAVVYLIEKYGHEPDLVEFGKIINDEIGKLDSFISNFLSASRGEKGFIPVNINNILKTILVMIKPRIEVQKITVLHNFATIPLIAADPFQTEQAFFNIINNAIEAMPDGGSLSVQTSLTREDSTEYVMIEISDTGKGIPKKTLKRLGELPGNPEKQDRGFGIFLSREIIKAHNGKLLWESIRGRGTTFKILLPVKHNE